MLDLWSLVRFLHVVGAVVWLGGQLTVSALVMPVARDRLPTEVRAGLMRVLGMRFGIATVAVLIPLQVATGVALARHKGAVSYTHLRAHETDSYLVFRLLLEKKNTKTYSFP